MEAKIARKKGSIEDLHWKVRTRRTKPVASLTRKSTQEEPQMNGEHVFKGSSHKARFIDLPRGVMLSKKLFLDTIDS